ncbi:MAG: cytochrome c family protein [Gemmatales bacterium]
MRRFSENGYALSAGDLGDLASKEQAGAQNRWKYEVAVKSLKSMTYAGMALGPAELAMRHDTAFDLAQNYQPPVILAANFLDAEGQFPEMFKPFAIDDPRRTEDAVSLLGRLQGLMACPLPGVFCTLSTLSITGRPRVGYMGLVGDSVIQDCIAKKFDAKFSKPQDALAATLKTFLAAQPEVRVLLFQGTRDEATQILKAHPKVFHVVLCRNDASDGVAPLLPIKDESGSWIIMVGHKGRSAGVVAYRRGKPLEYRLEELVEELELPDDKTNAAREIMKEYVWGVHRNNYLKDVPKIAHPNQLMEDNKDAVFVGSAKCNECHRQAHAVWAASNHSHAWDNLVKNGRPIAEVKQKGAASKFIGRQYDPDCARCHVTGFGYKGGFEDEVKTPHLFGNGCENCHGPGSLHAGQPSNPLYRKPMVLSMEDKDKIGQTCMKCHDLDNDPHFDIAKWEKIKHGREK